MEQFDINESSLKYPKLSSIIKSISKEAYIKCLDKEYNLNDDIEVRIAEIFNNDLKDHCEEMSRISEMIKNQVISKRKDKHIWNYTMIADKNEYLGKKRIPISGFPSNIKETESSVFNQLNFSDEILTEISLTHKNRQLKKIVELCKQKEKEESKILIKSQEALDNNNVSIVEDVILIRKDALTRINDVNLEEVIFKTGKKIQPKRKIINDIGFYNSIKTFEQYYLK